jgi:hypothetical protein
MQLYKSRSGATVIVNAQGIHTQTIARRVAKRVGRVMEHE